MLEEFGDILKYFWRDFEKFRKKIILNDFSINFGSIFGKYCKNIVKNFEIFGITLEKFLEYLTKFRGTCNKILKKLNREKNV